MPSFTRTGNFMACCCAFLSLCAATAAYSAMDPSFELDPGLLRDSAVATKPVKKVVKPAAKAGPARKSASAGGTREHTVRAGDNLFKILMRDYGMTNAEAEACIAEILRENRIGNIRRLKVGQKIQIPPSAGVKGADTNRNRAKPAGVAWDDAGPVALQPLRLQAPLPGDDAETLQQVTTLWNMLVPLQEAARKPLRYQTATYSLTLDPERFPVFHAMDGARIVLDQHDAIPPLVKSLITEKDPAVRIVSGAPMNSLYLLSKLLGAAGFYSVEENFVLEFGADPKLRVRSDFKVERTPESLIKQDVILLNGTKNALPHALVSLLKQEGFALHEPFARSAHSSLPAARGALRQVTASSRPEMVDAILDSLAVSALPDRRVDVFGADNNGISLSVKAERYFERAGKRYVIAGFDGDPVAYTLFRILETKGHRVIMLAPEDDFRTVSEKILSSLQISGNYAQHMLIPEGGANYSLRMSGFRLEGAGVPGGSLFLTNRPLDRIVRDLLTENGYDVQVK